MAPHVKPLPNPLSLQNPRNIKPKPNSAMQQSTSAHVISNHPFNMATTTVSRPPAKLYDLDLTIVSAKHLKNVNWLRGDLKPYVILWVDPDRRLATKSDDSGNTRPVWNERFLLPLVLPPQESVLTLEIFHSKPSETPKPLVGTLRVQLSDLIHSEDSIKLRKFELLRPSGRPQGKICLKLTLRERIVPDYQITPPSSYYYSTVPPPPPSTRDYRGFSPSSYNSHPPSSPSPPLPPPPPPPSAMSPPLPPPPTHSYQYSGYSDQYSGYYPVYYSHTSMQPRIPPPPRPFFDRNSGYNMPGPSAPVDYSPYDQKRGGKLGMGAGLGVGAVAGGLGGLALDERAKYEEEKLAENIENELDARDDYSDYRAHY